jgi:hypothetical protein
MRTFGSGVVLVLGILSLGTGCGGTADDGLRHCNDGGSGNTLRGSYCEGLDVAFSEVKALTVSTALRIEYVRPIGTGSEKTLQLILDGSVVILEPNVEIKLLDAGAQVRRILADAQAPQNLTDELEPQSSITFTTYSGEIGSRITGSFAILLKSGRTLSGDFDATIEDARPPS